MILRNELKQVYRPGLLFEDYVFEDTNFWLCADGVRKHFQTGRRKTFTFCVSNKRPGGSDWYLLKDENGYVVADTETWLPSSFDAWAWDNFGFEVDLYIWIEL